MIKKRGKEIYQPPYAQDLSGFSANGQVQPMGVCKAGTSPFYNCTAGPSFLGTCGPGTAPDTSNCIGGGYHAEPSCGSGSDAATICKSGHGQAG